MLIALPNLDKSFTCTLFMGYETFGNLTNSEKMNEFFDATFPDAKKLIPDLEEQFFKNPTSFLSTVR